MLFSKFIPGSVLCLAIGFAGCPPGDEKISNSKQANADTVYITSTAALKSNLVPDSVFNMTQLKTLVITGSDCHTREFDKDGNDITKCWMIKTIPPAIGNLTNLDTLRLTLAVFGKFPDEIAKLQKLRFLDLTDSYMQDIDNLASLENLNQLLLFGCGLTKLPTGIGKLKKLRFLGLSGNQLDAAEIDRIKQALPDCKVYYQ
jgi:Leucine-rich repeat (LRR) protein